MSGFISLTPTEQTRLTIAVELDSANFPEAAAYLRSTITALRHIEWNDRDAAERLSERAIAFVAAQEAFLKARDTAMRKPGDKH